MNSSLSFGISSNWASSFRVNLLSFKASGTRRCRSPQDFIAMQSELARDAMQQAVETSRRIGQVSMRVADEAAGIIQTTANAKPERARQVA